MAERKVADAPAPQAPKPEKYERKVTTTTLGDLGDELPVGVVGEDGKLDKSFSFKDFKVKDERALAKLKDKDAGLAKTVSTVVVQLLQKLGPYSLESQDDKKGTGLFQVSRMYMADVFYMYLRIRQDAIGDELKLKITCECKEKFTWKGKLSTVEVRTVEREADLLWYYDVKKNLVLREKKIARLGVTTPRWFSLEGLKSGDSDADVKIATIQGSILTLNDDKEQVQLTDVEIDEFSKKDLEGIVAAMDANAVGADMSIEGNCPSCKAHFMRVLDWNYDNFFAISSRS